MMSILPCIVTLISMLFLVAADNATVPIGGIGMGKAPGIKAADGVNPFGAVRDFLPTSLSTDTNATQGLRGSNARRLGIPYSLTTVGWDSFLKGRVARANQKISISCSAGGEIGVYSLYGQISCQYTSRTTLSCTKSSSSTSLAAAAVYCLDSYGVVATFQSTSFTCYSPFNSATSRGVVQILTLVQYCQDENDGSIFEYYSRNCRGSSRLISDGSCYTQSSSCIKQYSTTGSITPAAVTINEIAEPCVIYPDYIPGGDISVVDPGQSQCLYACTSAKLKCVPPSNPNCPGNINYPSCIAGC